MERCIYKIVFYNIICNSKSLEIFEIGLINYGIVKSYNGVLCVCKNEK